MTYRYRHGDRPLDGYTVLRGLGRGGFGEVYYAVSDGGREVALKVIQQNHDIELRGVRQCMNLKSPHLVCIFDVKTSPEETPFVIMEYVSGPSLRDIIQQAPKGLGTGKATLLLERIARGLQFLHDNGIVHRDLKPENIFYEDGYAKIGDYGLSKFISVSRQSGQTMSVGTVHYMAPEIGSGNYSAAIDIYALGVIYYELLTGKVPYEGDSMGEILMKHLTAEPDLSPIDEALRPIVARALAKKPEERYARVDAMIEELHALPGVRGLVSDVPEESFLSASPSRPEPPDGTARLQDAATIASPRPGDPPAGQRVPTATAAAFEATGEGARPTVLTPPPAAPPAPRDESAPEIAPRRRPRRHPSRRRPEAVVTGPRLDFKSADGSRRLIHGAMTAMAMALALTIFCDDNHVEHFVAVGLLLAATTGALLVVESWLAPRFQIDMGIARRLTAVAVAGPALSVSLWSLEGVLGVFSDYQNSLLALFASLVFINWSERVERDRTEQISLGNAFTAGLFGFIASKLTDGDTILTSGLMASTSLVLNAVSPCRRSELQSGGEGAEPTPKPHAIPATRSASGFWGRAFWILLIGGVVYVATDSIVPAVACAMILAFIFLAGRRRQTSGGAYPGWVAMGSLLMVLALLVAFAGGVLVSGLGGQLLEGAHLEVPPIVTTFGSQGEHLAAPLVFFVPAVVSLLLARRWAGAPHILRGAVGWAGVGVLVGVVLDFLQRHKIRLDPDGLNLTNFDEQFSRAALLALLLVGITSAVCLAWPGAPSHPDRSAVPEQNRDKQSI